MSLESIVEIYLLIFLSLAAFDPVHNGGEGVGGAKIFQFEIPWIFYLIDKDRIQFKFMSKSVRQRHLLDIDIHYFNSMVIIT